MLVTSDDPHSPSLSRCKGFEFEGPQGLVGSVLKKGIPFTFRVYHIRELL